MINKYAEEQEKMKDEPEEPSEEESESEEEEFEADGNPESDAEEEIQLLEMADWPSPESFLFPQKNPTLPVKLERPEGGGEPARKRIALMAYPEDDDVVIIDE